jgi:hypothetical protein
MRLVTAAVAAACLAGAVVASAAAVPAASAAIAGLPITHITPNPSAPGTATTFTVFCGRDAKSATLFGTTLGLADLNTMNSAPGARAGTFVITLALPPNIAPRTYHPGVECSNGLMGNATMHVSPVPVRAPETGDGTTATETGSVLEPVGYGLIAIGVLVLTGALALRRRTVPRN